MIFQKIAYRHNTNISVKLRKYWIFLTLLFVFHSGKILAKTLKQAQDKNLVSRIFPTKCFKHIGCFNSGPPFYDPIHRPISLLPQDDVIVNYPLYTPTSLHNEYNISLTNKSISDSTYNSSLPTMILIPGYIVDYEPGKHEEMFDIKNEVLKYYSYNVIIIDWTRSNNFPYVQAIANGRKVGALIAYLLKLIKKIKGLDYNQVHIVGHSLGAHVAGWTGERINKIGRITALDPAGPAFQHATNAVRLDTTDAKFVDVIHTNGADTVISGFGLFHPIGDVDFYPNGGSSQPKCEKKYNAIQIIEKRSCDHSISMNYFQASIHSCTFMSARCKNYDSFKDGKCTTNNSITDDMGFFAKPVQNETAVKFYLKTTSKYPFCNDSNSSSS